MHHIRQGEKDIPFNEILMNLGIHITTKAVESLTNDNDLEVLTQ